MFRNLRHLMIPSLLLGVSFTGISATVSREEAAAIATEFMSARGKTPGAEAMLKPVFQAGSDSVPLYYVFNFPEGGFVIVSGEDSTNPVLGYSMNGRYDTEDLPGAMKWMMAGLERELLEAPKLQQGLGAAERRRMAARAAAPAEEHLLPTAKWSQEAPFNAMIPGNPLVGCVGTAMATIMKYHRWPVKGTGSFGGVNFDTVYDWDSMRADNYRSGYTQTEADAVALLMYHASKSIDTQYAMSGSSAYEVRVPGALASFFGYDPGVSYKKRADVATQEAWDAIVRAEIDEGRPVLYCGQDVTAGHAFVCDGYQGEYLHFNWGWGGSADGYFLSTALNPTVSRTHHYNNLNTIIYNIKPAAGSISVWSPVRITADGNQPGIGSDLTDLSSGEKFKVRVGNLKNVTYSDFKGKIAVALCAADGSMKALLSAPSNFSLKSMEYLFDGFKEFSGCFLPSGTSVAAGDMVRIMTLADGETSWLPVAGELSTLNELSPAPGTPASFRVTLPAGVAGVTVEGPASVIRGWNYSFKVTPQNPAEDVVTVKANGYVLTPGSGYAYSIVNVREDQEVTVLVQKAADVREKRSVWVNAPGTLSQVLGEEEAAAVKELTLFGSIDARDFEYMKNAMRLTRLDLSGAYISANGANQANAIPRDAFRGLGTLQEVVLPQSVNRLNNGCFRQCGITTITIPAGVKTYEYNVFVGASKLRHIYVCRETAEFINWCVLSGVNTSALTLHVPTERALTNYSKAENWNTIANIVVDPVQASDEALFAVMDNSEVQFESASSTGLLPKGTKVSFKANHIADNDNRMEVYANSTLLTPDADGTYTAEVNGNTMIHFDMVKPIGTENNGNSQWTLTGKNCSVGLLTDAVNVIRGQEFTIRVNALNIPQGLDQLFWAAALTDSKGNIKEFISPAVLWTAGAGDNFRMNVNCKVNDCNVREGNQIRLVTSANNKKTWQVVKGSGEGIVDVLPALNNVTPVYNIHVAEVQNATVSGVTPTAVRGRDMTLRITPNSAAYRVNLTLNGEQILAAQPTINYSFVAMEDMNFEAEVYDPKAGGVAKFTVARGTFHNQLTEDNVASTVIVVGEAYSLDLQAATGQAFACNTIKTLDLSGLKIVGTTSAGDGLMTHPLFTPTNSINQLPAPVLENLVLPGNLKQLATGVLDKCSGIKEIVLPESMSSVPWKNEGSNVFQYAIQSGVFKGFDKLTTIYIPGTPGTYDGRTVVAHHSPRSTDNSFWYDYYNLGFADPKKVTVIVPEEYLSVYRTAYNHKDYGNPWKAHGYNILSEYPVYGVNFDPTRVAADADVDVTRMASFLGDNVALSSIKTEGKLRLLKPDARCLVFDNGTQIQPNADGTIDVEFLNPAKNTEGAGNHEIDVIYAYDVNFAAQSDLFEISEPEVTNGKFQTSSFDTANTLEPVLKNVAENSNVRFRVGFTSEHEDGLELRVMSGIEELIPDAEGYYSFDVTNAARKLDIFAVPGQGAVLNAEELAAINPDESKAITAIALAGEMTAEDLSHAVECFPELESLDLSRLEGEIPEGFLSGMETLETVVLPEVETISANMFSGCSNLTSVEVPTSVNIIGEGAFKDCSSLETLRLTGVESIGDGAFSGCDNLTTITLLADVAADPAGKPAKQGHRRAAGIGSRAFEGLNPNCIILLDEGVAAPEAEANYMHTATGLVTEKQPDGSELEREGRIYSINTPMTFNAGYPLTIPHTFTIDEGASVSLVDEFDGWKGVVVPFDVEKMTDASGATAVIDNDDEEGIRVYTLREGADGLEAVEEIRANVPMLMHSSGKLTFSATSGQVASTPASVSVEGKDYTLASTYTSREINAGETYHLNANCSAFEPAGADGEMTEVHPFEVYATSPVSVPYILTELPGVDNITVGVKGVEIADGIRIARDGNLLVIFADSERSETLYDTAGRVLRTLTLAEGRNVVEMPGSGVYFLGGVKFMF